MNLRNSIGALFLVASASSLHTDLLGTFLKLPDLTGDRLIAWSVFITGAVIVCCLPVIPKVKAQ